MSGALKIETRGQDDQDLSRRHVWGACALLRSGNSSGWKGKLEALNELASSRNYTIQQINGQRTYGGPPPEWIGPPPPRGCEVFVGNVPRDVFEDEVVPIFESAGKIYELRMMLDFSGTNRGYFFVRYSCREEAVKAIRCLDGYEIRPGKYIGVKVSADNRKLFVSGLPSNVSSDSIMSELDQIIVGVLGVKVFPISESKACCIVEFETHKAAAQARRTLVPQKQIIAGNVVQIEWAKVQHQDDEERSLIVKKFSPGLYRDTLWRLFSTFSKGSVEGVKMFRTVAIVSFSTKAEAERALRAANTLISRGTLTLEVSWAKTKRASNSSGEDLSDREDSPFASRKHLDPISLEGASGLHTWALASSVNHTRGALDEENDDPLTRSPNFEELLSAIERLHI